MAEWALGFLHIRDEADQDKGGGWAWLSFNSDYAPDNSGSWGDAVADLGVDGWEYVESSRYQADDDAYGIRYVFKKQLDAD